nr:hypothetical protein [Gammaproteobacteria bacterium]
MYNFRTLVVLGALCCFGANAHAVIMTSTDPNDFVLTAEDFPITSPSNANQVSVSGRIILDNIAVGNPRTTTASYRDFNPVMAGGEYVLSGDENF